MACWDGGFNLTMSQLANVPIVFRTEIESSSAKSPTSYYSLITDYY